MEPITGAQWLAAGSQLLSGALGKSQTPNQATSTALSDARVESWLDSSGWTVATGGSKAEGGSRAQGLPADIQAAALPILIVAALAGLYIWKRA